MNEENNNGIILDDFDYSEPVAKRDGPQGVAAPVLDDMDFVAPTAKRDGPQGVAAPVLDDMDSFTPNQPKKLILSDEDIINGLTPELKMQFDNLTPAQKQQVIDMRRNQLGAEAPQPAVSAAILDDDNYIPQQKPVEQPQPAAPPVSSIVLDEEPAQPERQMSDYERQELERIKAEAKKQAVSSSLSTETVDKKESLAKLLALRESQNAEKAEKGFKILIILGVIGVIGAVAFYLLYSGKLGLDYKEGTSGLAAWLENSSFIISVAIAFGSLVCLTGIKGLKSLGSFALLVSAVLQIFPGLVMISQHNGSMALVILLYAIAFGCTVGVFVTLSASECIGQYFKQHSENNY